MPRMPSPIRTGRISPNRSRSGSPISPRVPTPTANDFPTPSGQVFKVTKRDKGLISPAQSAFSFADDDSPGLAISTPPTPPDIYDEKPAMQPMKQGAPGDSSISLHRLDTSSQAELRKKRSQFYTEVFAYKESDASPKEQVYKESIVSAELKTNVIVGLIDQTPAQMHAKISRLKTNTSCFRTCPSSFHSATNARPLQSHSPSPTPPACFLAPPSSPLTPSPFLPSLLSSPQPSTNATQLSSNPSSQMPWESHRRAASSGL